MELYTGTSVIDLLNQRLSAGTRLRQREVLHIFSDVAKAVARLHHRAKPIIHVHRDLKIENILHDSVHDTYILCDYGSCLLKSMHPEEMGATECSDEISRFTTIPYRSPEMVSVYPGKTITTKSDI
ncbi:AP2-associated protein kinase 1-like [Halichondria panicea]|uniref:AP2-associated protein kinase 1-like n=1 Tax=Halichondria panicea TaxID=6063 RepID=UPI00312BA215